MSLHMELAAAIEETFAARLAAPVDQKQDALIISLANDVIVTVRYAAPDAYSLRWTRRGAEAGIDTAPLHRELTSFPNHLHDATGQVRPDPITRPDRTPFENVRSLIEVLLDDPTLGLEGAA